ncbi:sensor histidine kinase [Dactylosporangium sp. NPDC048998]|uniref:sensor histidine kinase n=1 Tax=Dactylosporangium sp. NPDC048998 TaxID=3363976 RepID=UPI003715E613
MLSRLTLRWRLTLLQTVVFLVAGAVVITMVYLQNRIVITKAIAASTLPDDTARLAQPVQSVQTPTLNLDAIAIRRNEALGTLLIQWIMALIVMTAMAGLLAWWVTGRVLNRVHLMSAQARRISTANLHERIAVQGPTDEIKELSDTFNDLLNRLEEAFNAQARFIANASHELRTPLTVARTTLQVGLATTDPARINRVREELLRNNDRCIALINGLLTLARGEQGQRRLEAVELDEIVHQVAAESTATAPPDGPRLQVDVPARCTVSGDPLLLAQLVHNLLDNAVRYNRPGGEVLVELDTLDADVRLTVSNTGPAIGADEADRLFEPFYRGAERTGHTDGAGLGMSIVRAIADNSGGQASARPRDGGGLVVEVLIPTTDAQSLTAVP